MMASVPGSNHLAASSVKVHRASAKQSAEGRLWSTTSGSVWRTRRVAWNEPERESLLHLPITHSNVSVSYLPDHTEPPLCALKVHNIKTPHLKRWALMAPLSGIRSNDEAFRATAVLPPPRELRGSRQCKTSGMESADVNTSITTARQQDYSFVCLRMYTFPG